MQFFGPLMGAGFGVRAARLNAESAAQANKERLKLIQDMDWEPMLTSDLAPTYKRSQSPVGRSFLESLVMGNNPAAISPTTPGAGLKRAAAQASQNAMFGTPEERVARQRQIEQETPWAVQTPTRRVKAEQAEDAITRAQNPVQTASGVTSPRLLKALEGAGYISSTSGKWDSIGDQLRAQQMIKAYPDQERLAELLEQGGYKAVQADFRSRKKKG